MKMKRRTPYRPMVHQQELRDNWNISVSSSPSPVLKGMNGSPLQTGSETGCALTTADTERDTTGTGVQHKTATVTAVATDETTETSTARTGIVCLLLNVDTGTGSSIIIGSELPRTTGATTATGAPTIPATSGSMGATSGGDTLTVTSLTAVGGGSRTVEGHGQ